MEGKQQHVVKRDGEVWKRMIKEHGTVLNEYLVLHAVQKLTMENWDL